MFSKKMLLAAAVVGIGAGLAWLVCSGSKSGTEKPAEYIGNVNALKFHLPGCRVLPQPANQVVFWTREVAVADGYKPCAICRP